MHELENREREIVIEDLQSPDEEVRRLAVERIDLLHREEVLPYLVERMGDSDWRVRKAAVRRLVARADIDEVSQRLVEALGDGENPGRRNSAVEALIEIGERTVESLVASSSGTDADVRKFVVDALAGIGSERAVDALVARLEDEDPNVRAAAADALGAIGGRVARAALRETAIGTDGDPLVRFSALHALDALEEPLRAEELASVLDDPMLGPAGLGLLGRCDDPGALDALVKGLGSGIRAAREASMRSILRLAGRLDGAELADLREHLATVSDFDPALVRVAISRLVDSDLGTQLVVVQFLGLIRSREAVIPILEAGSDEALAPVAIGALEEIGREAVDEIDEAWDELDFGRRCAACEALGRIGGARALERLLAVLEDFDPSLRAAAARALAALGAEQALAPLVRRLQRSRSDESFEGDEEPDALADAIVALAGPDAEGRSPGLAGCAVELLGAQLAGATDGARLTIARVLGAIARPNDMELIATLLRDPTSGVRRAAVDAIARLETGSKLEALHLAIADEAPMVRIAAARALGSSWHEAVFEDLRRLSEDEDPRVRAEAVRAIGVRFAKDTDPVARVTAFAELTRACDDNALVALAVVDAACEIGGDAVGYAEPLLSRSEPEVVIEAARCLGVHADDSELEMLMPLVSHPDWSVRAEVVEILGNRRFRRAIPAILRSMEIEQDDFVRNVTLNALQRLEA
jgi:HEAT repeat protein